MKTYLLCFEQLFIQKILTQKIIVIFFSELGFNESEHFVQKELEH